MRDFVFVYLPLYLRGFAIFLIFASPVLAALHFHDALCYFDKVVYYVPSFGLFALSVIWIIYGYGLEKYIDYEQNLKRPLGRATLPRVDRYAIIIIGTQIVLFFVSGITLNCLALFQQTISDREWSPNVRYWG